MDNLYVSMMCQCCVAPSSVGRMVGWLGCGDGEAEAASVGEGWQLNFQLALVKCEFRALLI